MATVDLTDDIRQDEPVAYLVFCSPRHAATEEYRVYCHEQEARDYARECEDDARDRGDPTDWPVYPLYAGHPLSNTD